MGRYSKDVDHDWYKHRLIGAMFCVIGAFLVLIARLFYLQIIEGHEYRRLSENQCVRLQGISAPRGVIFDKNGTLLVDNHPSFNLSIILKDARPLEDVIKKLSFYSHIPEKELMKTIRSSKRVPSYKPLLLKSDINRDVLAAIETHRFDLPGIIIDVKPKRQYFYNDSAAHLIGYIGEINSAELKSGKYPDVQGGELVGKFGVEKSQEHLLRGKNGGRQVEVNSKGQVARVLSTVEAAPGNNIYMTFDLDLQKKAEALMVGKVGGVVAMECNTGHILALVSSPSFDLNAFISGMSHKEWNNLISNPFRPMENKVVQGEYPPASTYKIVTAIAGLEEGVIDEKTTFFCPGHYRYGNRTFRCWKRSGHGRVNIYDALAFSCDVYFYQTGQRLGVDRLAVYAKKCGLGSPTKIELGHEGTGLIPTSAWKKKRLGIPWQKGETLSIAIGQGYNLVTPLQMAVLVSAVASDGNIYRPHIVDRAENILGEIVYKSEKEIMGHLPVSRNTLEIIRKGLWEVVNGRRGTAKRVAIEGVELYGKTGTAQVVSRKTNDNSKKKLVEHLKPHAWFVAYGKKDDSCIGVSVIVEHGEHGSGTAAPIAGELIKVYLLGEDNDEKDSSGE